MKRWEQLKDRRLILVDFNSLDVQQLGSTADLFAWFSEQLAASNPDYLEGFSVSNSTAKSFASQVISRILKDSTSGVTLLIDDSDRLFGEPLLCSELFSLLRSWHNKRAFEPEVWALLDIVITHSSDPDLWIKDPTQSPWNVAYRMLLPKFERGEIEQLIDIYKRVSDIPFPSSDEILALTGGQPYLTQLVCSLCSTAKSIDDVLTEALQGESQLGQFLRRKFIKLHVNSTLDAAMKTIFFEGHCVDLLAFDSLWQSGLVQGNSHKRCELSCGLYKEYCEREFK
jgi:hypothetical protein